ncbi:MAG: LPS assembly protein LptD, partial [Gammaproteobacteria bacterium]|nr:LPS assembly protein LptD [Gammaproteobacteria bacterium]
SNSVFNNPPVLPSLKDPKQLDISANTIQSVEGGISLFENNVLIEKDGFRLSTDKIRYDQKNSTLSLPLPSHIENEKIIFDSKSGEINSDTEISSFSDVDFIILSNHMQGSSPEIKLVGDTSTSFSQVNFTSCEPGKESWLFSADKLELDHIDESGSAHNAVIRVKDIPIFYLPYVSFPLGERRRSGILTPELVFSDSGSGDQLRIPYYWNIAPNQDATITPVYLQNRGLQLITNYRYLTSNSTGEIDIEYLANDRLAENDPLVDEERYLSKFIHQTKFTPQLNFNVNVTSASDSHYLSDFGQSLDIASITHLQQSADFQYQLGHWKSKLLVQDFQTTDDTILWENRPYRRQPQLTVNGSEAIIKDGPEFKFAGEWVSFDHQCESTLTIGTLCTQAKDIGRRTDLYPQLTWPMQGSYWFFTPNLGHRFTAYDVTNEDTPVEIDDRSLSIFQLDSGLFFERKLSSNYTQTLEPRLYYLNVPAVDQSLIPLFDTSETSFTFAQLFRDNRFNGADRIGDANQLSTALTTRIINDENGNERFSASIGQIHYFDDRVVNLSQSDNTIHTASTSDIAAEFVIRDVNWSYRLSALQNTESDEVDQGSFLYHYQTDNRHIFNLGYRYNRDTNVDQSDLSFKLPVSDHWSVLARWNYSLTDDRDLESIAGFEYNSCCWAFRIVSRGHITQDASNQDIFDRSILFTLVLKGLGSTGKANDELERAILGFHPEY